MTRKWQINLLFLAQFIIIACLDMSDPYWPLILHHLNAAITPQHLQYWSAAIYIVPFFITIITTPLWSHLGDKIGHKKMLLRACCALVFTQLLISFTTNPALILGLRLLQGAFAGYTAAAQAWSIQMSQPGSHSSVIGRMQAATAIGSIVGPIFGGFIANFLGYTAIFFLSGTICGLVVILLGVYLQESVSHSAETKSSSIKNLLQINKNASMQLILICLTQAAKWMSSSFFALYCIEQLHGSNLTVGVLYSVIALSVFLSAPRWGIFIDNRMTQPSSINQLLMVTLFMACITQCLFALTTHFYVALIASVVLGVCLGAISLIPFMLLMKQAGTQSKSSLIGLGNSASKLGNLIGVAMGALIQAATNFTDSFVAIGFLYFILGMFLARIPSLETQNVINENL